MNYQMYAKSIATALLLGALASCASAITVGEADNFSSSLEGWTQGESSAASGVSRVTSGGPAGASDPYMRIIADSSQAHGKIVVFNESAAWTGNYTTSGVVSLSMAVNNQGVSDLRLRLAFGTSDSPDSGGSWLASTNGVNVPSGSGWMNVQFPIAAADLTVVQGTSSYSAIMSSVSTLRLLHSPTPSNRGPNIVATLGVDSIMALGAPAIAGDFDKNRMVNSADLAKWQVDFAMSVNSDADGDGDSDGADFLLWQRNFGTVAAAAVPEPSALGLCCLATLCTWRARRTRGCCGMQHRVEG